MKVCMAFAVGRALPGRMAQVPLGARLPGALAAAMLSAAPAHFKEGLYPALQQVCATLLAGGCMGNSTQKVNLPLCEPLGLEGEGLWCALPTQLLDCWVFTPRATPVLWFCKWQEATDLLGLTFMSQNLDLTPWAVQGWILPALPAQMSVVRSCGSGGAATAAQASTHVLAVAPVHGRRVVATASVMAFSSSFYFRRKQLC